MHSDTVINTIGFQKEVWIFVLSSYFDLFPQFKDMHVRLTGLSKFSCSGRRMAVLLFGELATVPGYTPPLAQWVLERLY